MPNGPMSLGLKMSYWARYTIITYLLIGPAGFPWRVGLAQAGYLTH